MKSFIKLACILVAATLIICSFAGCEEKRNSNPTINAPSTKPSTGGEFIQPSIYSVKIDNYALPYTFSSYIPEKELTLYKNIVNTYLNFGNSVQFDADVKYDLVVELIETYFPVIYSDTSGIVVNMENNTLGWIYSSKSKTEHDNAISEFTSAAEQYLINLRFDDSETETAMLIYERLYKNTEYFTSIPQSDETTEANSNSSETVSTTQTSSITQTSSVDQTSSEVQSTNPEQTEPTTEPTYPISSYSPIIYKKGNSIMLSRAYCYLLIQAGIDSIDLQSDNDVSNEIVRYGFAALKLENKWYYADPGEGVRDDSFTNFGFSESQLETLGFGQPENSIITACSEKTLSEIILCDSNRFFDFSTGAYKAELDTEKNSLIYETAIGVKWNFTRLHG